MSNDLYKEFAADYDLMCEEFGVYDSAFENFCRRLVAQYGLKSVLDCACGTGRHLPLFLRLGCRVQGSDLSEAMLEQARSKLAARQLNVPLTRLDFRVLHHNFGPEFDAVACLSTTLPHLSDFSEVLTALVSMRAVLRPKGLLLIDQGFSDAVFDSSERFIPAYNSRDFSRVFVLDRACNKIHLNILDLHHSAERSDLHSFQFEYLVIRGSDYERLLHEAGFSQVEIFGGYGFEPYDAKSSKRCIVAAVR